jgi:hypothetical protein
MFNLSRDVQLFIACHPRHSHQKNRSLPVMDDILLATAHY